MGLATVAFSAKSTGTTKTAPTEEDFKENSKTHEKKYKGKFERPAARKSPVKAVPACADTFLYECQKENGNLTGVGARIPIAQGKEGFLGFFQAQVECATEHATGEAIAADEVANVSVRFTGCSFFGDPATTLGLPAGEIQTETLRAGSATSTKRRTKWVCRWNPPPREVSSRHFQALEGTDEIRVGEGNAAQGAFYEGANGTPTGNDGTTPPITPVNQMTQRSHSSTGSKGSNPTNRFRRVYRPAMQRKLFERRRPRHCQDSDLLRRRTTRVAGDTENFSGIAATSVESSW